MLVAVCLGLSGCAFFQKKPAPAGQPGPDPLLPRPNPDRPAEPSAAAEAQPSNPVLPTSAGSGILAGQVIDSSSRPPAEAYILVTSPKQGREPEKKPIDVAANPQGYFTISGLTPGRHYQLIARARDGNRMLAGITWATPPNIRVLIRMREDFYTKNTPPIPPPPVWPGAKDPKAAEAQAENTKPESQAKPEKTAATRDPVWGPGDAQPAEPRREPDKATQIGPIQTPAMPVEPAPVQPDKTRIADNKNLAQNPSPPVWMGPRPSNQPKPNSPPVPSMEATRVPSCVLVGNQLMNFALYDLDDRVWQFRQRQGKLVLLDFWATYCKPCLEEIPHLKILQQNYRTAGLQVIGIAYEDGGTPQEQRRRVDDFCQVKEINYKVLMGSANCPVFAQFGIRVYPTLVLLDENGWIVWKHEGGLNRDELDELEGAIKRRLGVR
jgi:thiol-disulfide isomerase/thioredoxin